MQTIPTPSFRPHRFATRSGLVAAAIATLALACSNKNGPSKQLIPDDGRAAAPALPEGLPDDPSAPLPLSEKVTRGVLKNGLTYYVRENRKPQKRAELWLVIDAGSLHEDDDQRGLAHFVEHMAFNGTRSFPKNELLSRLRKLGVKFGPHVNAETTFDQTVYKLRVPTDDPAAIDLAMRILAEWAAGITFLAEDVEAERGVVLAEKRGKLGPEMRMLETLVEKLFAKTRYAERIPIGDPKIIASASPKTLERFYRDWYHPDNMAVIAVGDFDGAAIEKKVRQHFSDLDKAEDPRPQPPRTLPDQSEPRVLSLRDEELPISAVVVGRLRPQQPTASLADFRRAFVEKVATTMLRKRLEEARQKGEASYLMAAGGPVPLTRAADAIGFLAAVKPTEMKAGLEDLLAELERARRHGFLASELKRALTEVRAALESTAREAAADKESSTVLVEELVRHHLTGEAVPGRAVELAIFEHLAATVRLEEYGAVLDELLSAEDLVIASLAPAEAPLLSRADVLATLAALPTKRLPAYTDATPTATLLAKAPEPGTITHKQHHAGVGVFEWTLSNGARVVLKPTDFQEDQVLLYAASPGGHSLSTVKELRETFAAAAVVKQGGLGTFDATALEKALAGRRVEVSPFVTEYSEGVKGSASADDLETLMQLVYLSFQAPRLDEQAFRVWKESALQQVRLSYNKPEARFGRQLAALRQNENPRHLLLSEALIEGVDLEASFALYRDRLQDASDFTFILVGSFELEKVEPLVRRYLASLPDRKRTETARVDTWPSHAKKQRLVVRDGTTPRGLLSFYYSRRIEPETVTVQARAAWHLFGAALRMQLLDLFREKLGETYSVTSVARFDDRFSQATALFALQCEPDSARRLEKLMLAEIRTAVETGVASEYLQKAKKAALEQLEIQLEDNAYWRDALVESYIGGRPLTETTQLERIYRKLSQADVQRTARALLDPYKPVIGVLLPKPQQQRK